LYNFICHLDDEGNDFFIVLTKLPHVEKELLREIWNDLAAINRERAKAYEEASFENIVYNLELRGTFALLANQSRQNNFSLKQQLEKLPVRNTGGKKPLPQLTFGDLYSQWKEMSVSWSGMDVYEMLKSCEEGEEAILEIYKRAIDLLDSTELKTLLENQVRGLQNSYSIVKGLVLHPPQMPQRIKKSS
jgi:hypothetical protein